MYKYAHSTLNVSRRSSSSVALATPPLYNFVLFVCLCFRELFFALSSVVDRYTARASPFCPTKSVTSFLSGKRFGYFLLLLSPFNTKQFCDLNYTTTCVKRQSTFIKLFKQTLGQKSTRLAKRKNNSCLT